VNPAGADGARRRIAFVPSRYGKAVVGGAEAVLGELAHGFAGRGWEVEVLTTCARDHYRWANVEEPGVSADGAVTVRRFPAVVDTPRAERAALGARIVAGDRLTLAEQQRWMNDDMRVPELFHFLLDHGHRYQAVVFAPYLFWPAYACSALVPGRAVLWACAHDEPELGLEVFRSLFAGVAGVCFMAEPEHALAHRRFATLAPHAVVGAPVVEPGGYDPEGFRARHGIDGPFVVYAGRREGAKGWERLLTGFARALRRHDLPFRLVTMGVGEVDPPPAIAERVLDLGFVSDDERNSAFAAAAAYLQPSANEAFSRTVMEAWLAGTPVVANAASAVVAWHCERAGAGLTYADDTELGLCLDFVARAPGAARALAAPGAAYVRRHYTLDDVVGRVEAAIEGWTGEAHRS